MRRANTTCREPQLVKAALPAGEFEFDGQTLHVELNTAPTAVEYVPCGQSVHRAAPVDGLYFPATHTVQTPPAGPDEPALQVQLVKAALPTGESEFEGQTLHVELNTAPTAVEYVPCGQSVHRAAPVDGLYFPATHTVQTPPAGPDEPALQVQLVKAALPAGESEFDGQALHVELNTAPTAVEYVPSRQLLQSPLPAALYLPARHGVHVLPDRK
jgi:hypothetical protein